MDGRISAFVFCVRQEESIYTFVAQTTFKSFELEYRVINLTAPVSTLFRPTGRHWVKAQRFCMVIMTSFFECYSYYVLT